MPFKQAELVRFYEFESLRDLEITQAVFTRLGGVSPAPWDELNLGGTVGDNPENVSENRSRVFRAVGREVESLYDVWQVHSADVVKADAPRPLHTAHHLADAIITDFSEVTLLMRFADCVPVFLYDPMKHAIGLVHAGWQGTVKQVVAQAVKAMQAEFGTSPQDLLAAIGPSIGPDHYQVGPDVIGQVRDSFGAEASSLLTSYNSGVHLNLWEANRMILEHSGVRQIEVAEICTACHCEDWFSHRGEQGKTGRFGALIALQD